jgi:hypothetical protein
MVHGGMTKLITGYSDPRDVCTLTNGMQVGRLTCDGLRGYAYPMLLLGNLQIAPEGTKGKVIFDDFLAFLCPADVEIMRRLAAKVTEDRSKA